MTRSIRLTLHQQQVFVPNSVDGYRIHIQASEPVGMDQNVFLYQEYPPDTDAIVRSECVGVCTVPDYESLPTGAPRDGDDRRFRLAYVDQVFRVRDIALDAWNVYCFEVRRLLESLRLGDDLGEVDDVVIEA